MSKKLRALLERKQQALATANAIATKAETEKRELTADERVKTDEILASITALNGDIERQRQLDSAEASMTGIDVTDRTVITGGAPAVLQDPKRGFATFGEFCADVARAGRPGGEQSQKLAVIHAAAPSTYGSENVGQDGGYAVPPEYAANVTTHALEQDAILPLTDETPISGNSMAFPKDETTPWGSDGVRAYWAAEAATATGTKPKLGVSQQRLHKLLALVPMTEELLEDAPAMGAFVESKGSESIRWKANDAFVNGSGAGMPLGILAAPALVSVAKESGQAADTILVDNVTKMFARMPSSSLPNSRWMVNNDVLPQLLTLKIGDTPVFTPPGAIANAPNGLLLGRPIMISQHCKTVGDKGDIVFVDWKKYRTITKRGGIKLAVSMHLYFDAALQAFRLMFRVDGQPAFSDQITPANGSNKLSPYVTLDERA